MGTGLIFLEKSQVSTTPSHIGRLLQLLRPSESAIGIAFGNGSVDDLADLWLGIGRAWHERMFASWSRERLRRERRNDQTMLCQMTSLPHRLFWMRSDWWCQDCRQKIESCCEGGGCASMAQVLPTTAGMSAIPHA
jgi:hypothetical protein